MKNLVVILVLFAPTIAFALEDELFVEKGVKVIHEIRSESSGDQFGWIAQAIGDVDGDGITDFATSAPFKALDGPNAGRIYMYSGKTGKEIWRRNGMAGSYLGMALSPAGDVNADGVGDVYVGAVGLSTAFVFSGVDGSTIFRRSSNENGFFSRGGAGVGDVNHDGHADVLVGAPRQHKSRGQAFLYSGKDDALLHVFEGKKAGDLFGNAVSGYTDEKQSLIVIGATKAGEASRGRLYVYDGNTFDLRFVVDAEDTGVQLGRMFVSIVGDVDADGTPDVYGSDWADGAKGAQTGRIYVYSGKTGKKLHILGGEHAGDGFGIGSAQAGDIDGDGHSDLIIGAWQHGSGAKGAGKCYLYSGKTGSLLRTITSKVQGETFGFDTTNLGDVDGDGVNDLLITSAWSSINGKQSGRLFVISGRMD